MLKWMKPDGREIMTTDNEETIAYCTSLNWKPRKQAKATPKAKVKAAISPKEE